MSVFCNNNPTRTETPKERDFDPYELSDLAKRKIEVNKRNAMFGNLQDAADNVAAVRAGIEDLLQHEMAHLVMLRPGEYDRLGSFLAASLGETHNMLIGLGKSVPGLAHEQIVKARELAQNYLRQAGLYNSLQRVKAARDYIESLSTKYKFSEVEKQFLMRDAVEIGQIPKSKTVYGDTTLVGQFNGRRYTDFADRMRQMGLSQADYEGLVKRGADIASAFDEARILGKAMGISDISKLQGLGYFPRIATPDMSFYMRTLEPESDLAKELSGIEDSELRKGGSYNQNGLSTVWNRMRSTYHYMPEDAEIAAKFLGTSSNEIKRMVLSDDPREWRNFLQQSATPEQVDQLVDSGVLTKLPMSSREAYDYLVTKYELPHKFINEIWRNDPVEAIKTYTEGLKRGVANYASTKTVIKDGLQAGWTITKDDYDSLSAVDKSRYVNVGSLNPKQFGIDIPASDLYVHRVAADQWKAVMNVAASPSALAEAGGVWSYLHHFYKGSVNLSSKILFIGRMFWQSMANTVAAGGDMSRFLGSYIDYHQVMKTGFDSFDNAKPFIKFDGEMLTHRQFMQRALLHTDSSIAPWLVSHSSGEAINPAKLPGAIRNFLAYSDAFKDPLKGIHYGSELIGRAVDATIAPFVNVGLSMEAAAKLAVLQTVGERADGMYNLALMPKRFNKFEDAMGHIGEYFPNYADTGTAGKFVTTWLKPFATWGMKNLPLTIRNMLAEPYKYVAYYRLLSAWNQYEGANSIPEGGVRDFDGLRFPILVQKGPVDGVNVFLRATSYDPRLDALSFINDEGQRVWHAFGSLSGHGGNYSGSAERQRDQALSDAGIGGEDTWVDWLNDATNGTWLQNMVEELHPEGRDIPNPLAKGNTFLGIPMSRAAAALLSAAVPFTKDINDVNPGGVFGYAKMYDVHGNIVRPEQLSVFGTQRSDTDMNIQPVEKAWLWQLLRGTGLQLSYVRPAANMQYTFDEYGKAVDDVYKSIQNAQVALRNDQLTGGVPKAELDRRTKAINQNIDNWYQMSVDRGRVMAWMVQNHIPPSKAIEVVKQLTVIQNKAPLPGAEEMTKILTEALQLRRGMPNASGSTK